MSSYYKITKHPKTEKFANAALDTRSQVVVATDVA